jgi:protein-S-isoprenylcysteine O-methyltransferase Ste14
MFIALFVVAGLDYRWGWSKMSLSVTTAAVIIMLLGYMMFAAVIFQNAYAARTVDIQENQKIITTGLYAIVRHPLYLATLLVFLPMPLILGSWFAALPMLLYPLILVSRIKNEEALLIKELDGYNAYVQKVRYRLLPFIW